MINKVQLIGNLGRKPEARQAGSSTVCELNLATTSRIKRGENWEDLTEWHRVVLWGRDAENAAKYLDKGRQVYVEGRLQTRKWQDKEGNDRYTTEVVAREVKYLGGRGDSAAAPSSPSPSFQQGVASSKPAAGGFSDDEIPF